MNKPHIHAELIKAWADGAQIQYLDDFSNTWFDTRNNKPEWLVNVKYRIKPEPSDFEKYGIEVGDVWLTNNKTKLFIYRQSDRLLWVRELDSECNLPYKVNISKQFQTLLFRRGEVNKL